MRGRMCVVAPLLIGLMALSVSAQPWMKQVEKKGEKVSFEEAQNAFDDYWVGKKVAKGKGYKQFLRWAWFMENRLDENGKFNPAGQWMGWQEKMENALPSELDESSWTPMGPFDPAIEYYVGGVGRVNAIAFHPTDMNTLYLGAASGGLWKTINHGESWEPMTDNLPLLGISAILVDPESPETVYIGTGDRDATDTYSVGVLKSTDGGVTWNLTGLDWELSDFAIVNKMVMDPTDHLTILAATSHGIYRTTDGGDSWTLQTGTQGYKDLDIGSADGQTYFATRNSRGVFRSTDGGSTWSELGNGLPASPPSRIEVAVAPGNMNYVYALYITSDNGFHSIYRSSDGGDTWALKADSPNLLGYSTEGDDEGGQGWYDLTMAVEPSDPNVVYVGGVNIWKTTDGGTTWAIDGHWLGSLSGYDVAYTHADHHIFEFRGDRLYVGNDGGINYRSDDGNSYVDISYNLAITQIYRMGGYHGNPTPDLFLNGNQDNGTKIMYGEDWAPVLGGDGMECAIDQLSPNIMYGEVYYGDIYRTTDGAESWTNVYSGNGAWVTPFVLSPIESGTIYAGFESVYLSTDFANSFENLSPSIPGKVRAMAISQSNPQVLYATGRTQMVKTTDGGETWSYVALPEGGITYVAIHPTNPDIVYITNGGYSAGNKVFASFNGGDTWMNVSAGLPNIPVNCVILHPFDGSHVYVGTDVGVFYSTDAGVSWADYSNGLPNVIVNEMEIHQTSNTLIAATYGRGMWQTPAADVNAEPHISIMLPVGGATVYAGERVSISWQSVAITENVSIDVNYDYPDGEWTTIFENIENDNDVGWTVNGTATENARLRIRVADGDPDIVSEMSESFTLVVADVNITAPNGGESWALGERRTISWTTQELPSNHELAVELNRNYPDGEWEMLHPFMSNTGEMDWIVNGALSDRCRFRICSSEYGDYAMDISDNDFAIVEGTGVRESDWTGIPDEFMLAGAYPNPFNATSHVVVGLPQIAKVEVKVFNLQGAEVAKIVKKNFNPGYHRIALDATKWASGTYFVQVTVPGELHAVKRMTLIR